MKRLLSLFFFAVFAFSVFAGVPVRFVATGAAAGTTTTETAITLRLSRGLAATSTGASFVVPSGKKYRFTAAIFGTQGNVTGTAQSTVFNLRVNAAGATTTTSTPIVLSARCATPATTNAYDRVSLVPLDEALEISGDGILTFGVTAAATYTTNAPTWDVTLIGEEL